MFKKTLLFTVLIFMVTFLSSCFVDYGLDSENYDLVATSYNSEYNFGGVTKFAIIDSVVHFGEDGVTHAYDGQIITKLTEELTALGWQQVTDSTADVTIMMGTTSTTTVVYGSSSWWDYYSWYPGWSYYPYYGSGYSWYYPYYPTGYEYGYTYETGTLFVSMVDLRLGADNKLPVQWIAVLNGLMNATDVASRLN
ncbi:MAG: DUF4136 domain-containing protein, partial [Ignavibacteria bacterium]